MSCIDSPLGVNGVVQRLAQDCKIDAVFSNRRVFNIAKPVFEIIESVFLRQLRAELDHLRRIIDRNDFAGAARQQLRKSSLTRAKIDNHLRRENWDERVRQRFPGTPGDITASKLSSELVEIFARLILAFPQGQLQRGAIARGIGNVSRQNVDHFLHSTTRSVSRRDFGCPVVNIFASAPIFYDPRAFQLREMARDTGLAHAENLLQLGDRKLLLLEKQKQSQTGRIGEEPDQINR